MRSPPLRVLYGGLMRFGRQRGWSKPQRVSAEGGDARISATFRTRERPPTGETEPRGVRINHADGRVTECAVVRDPENDADGMAQWMAVAPEGTVFEPPGDTMSIEMLPPRTSIGLVLPFQP
jgi:hypothetical protein